MVVSGSGGLAAPLINLFSIPVITRLYNPAEVGVWALLVGAAAMLGPVATLRYELAAVLSDDDREAGRILTLCFLLVAAMSLVVWGATVVAEPWLQGGRWADSLGGRLWVIPVLVFFLGMKVAADGWAVRSRAFGLRAASLFALAAGTNGGQILAPLLGLEGTDGLIAGSIAGACLAAGVLVLPLAGREWRSLQPFTMPGELPGTAWRFQRFPRWSAPYTILGTLRREGFKLVLGSWGTESVVGAAAFSWRITNFPASMFSSGIRPVLFERAARAGSLADVGPFVRRLQTTLGAAALPALIIAELWAEEIFGFVFSEEWLSAVPYARLMMVPAAVFVCTNWLDRLFDVAGRQDLLFRLELIFSCLSLGGLVLGLLVFDNAVVGVGLMSLAMTLYHVTFGVSAWRLIRYAAKAGSA